jgi:hypothetical protein
MNVSDCTKARIAEIFSRGAVYICCDGVRRFDDQKCLQPMFEVDYTEMETGE